MAFVQTPVRYYRSMDYALEDVCPVHPCRKMDILNHFRNAAYGELNLHNLMLFERATLLVINSRQADMPVPCLRKSVINETYETSAAIVCRCTRGEQQIPYSTMPEMQAMNSDKKLEASILGALASTLLDFSVS